MSESEIKELCEKFLGRPFDSEDGVLLRNFLRDLQREKVQKDKKPQKINPVLLSPRGGSGEKPSYIKNEESSVDTNAIREERLAEAKSQAGVKDRLGNWQKKIEQGDQTPTSNQNLVEERVAEAKNVGVKDRLGSWQKKLEEGEAATSDSNLVEERVAEAKGAGVKDRLGSWQKKLEEGGSDSNVSDPHKKDEILNEIGGAGKIKDRLQSYNSAVTTEKEKPKVDDEVLVKSHSVQKGRETWLKAQDSTASTDPNTIAERTAEVKSSGSLKDRMNSYQQTAHKEEVYARKEPIKIDFF
jgi:hypothetical protein